MQRSLTWLNNLLFYLIVFLFIFIPLYPKFPLINIAGTFVAIRLEDLIIGLTVSLWGIYLILSNQLRTFLKDRINQAILSFFFIGFISIFSALFLTHTVSASISILHLLRRVEFMILLPVVSSVVKNRKELVIILVFLFLTILSVDLYAFGQQYLDWPVISTTNSEFSKGLILRLTPDARVNSTFAGHYDLAVFLAMALVILVPIFFAVRRTLKPAIVILGLISLVVLIMTAARLSFVAAFIGILFALIFSKKKKYILLILIFTLVILIYPSQLRDRFVSTITINLLNLGQRYQSKIPDQQIRSKLNIPTLSVKTSSNSSNASIFQAPSATTASDITPGEPVDATELGVYRSFEIRLHIEWPRAIAAFIKNPLLGTGYSSIDIATDNDFLRSLGEVGILGTFALVLVLIEVAKRIFKIIKSENRFLRLFSAGILSMLVAFLINGLFIDVFEASKVASLFWMMLGLNLAVLNFKDEILKDI